VIPPTCAHLNIRRITADDCCQGLPDQASHRVMFAE
jgi:hypothetical protein